MRTVLVHYSWTGRQGFGPGRIFVTLQPEAKIDQSMIEYWESQIGKAGAGDATVLSFQILEG